MENYKRVEKGYCVNLSRIKEGYMTDTISCSAPNLNKAKYKLLKELLNDGWELNTGE